MYVNDVHALVAIDKETGQKEWVKKYHLVENSAAPVVFKESVAIYRTDSEYNSYLTLVNKNGEEDRVHSLKGNEPHFAPIATDDGIVTWSTNKSDGYKSYISFLDDQLKERWRTTFDGYISYGAASKDSIVLTGTENFEEGENTLVVLVLGLDTGKVHWKKEFPRDYSDDSPPIITNSKIAVGGFNSLYFLKDPTYEVNAEINGKRTAKPGEEITLRAAQESFRTYWDIDEDGCYERVGREIVLQSDTSTSLNVKMARQTKSGEIQKTSKRVYFSKKPMAEFEISPQQPTVKSRIKLNASSSHDPDGEIQQFEWDVNDDGKFEKTEKRVTHSYNSTGKKHIKLRVTDGAGVSTTRSKSIMVRQGSTSQGEDTQSNTSVPGFRAFEGIAALIIAAYGIIRIRNNNDD